MNMNETLISRKKQMLGKYNSVHISNPSHHRFNENPDVHHMSPRKNGTLTSLKKKLRMSSDGDEVNKRNSGETKGKRSSATPHAGT